MQTPHHLACVQFRHLVRLQLPWSRPPATAWGRAADLPDLGHAAWGWRSDAPAQVLWLPGDGFGAVALGSPTPPRGLPTPLPSAEMEGVGGMGGGPGRKNQVEREEVGGESLLNWSQLSYKSRAFQIGSIAGVECKKLAPKRWGEPLFNM
jgi:hypothetical protein